MNVIKDFIAAFKRGLHFFKWEWDQRRHNRRGGCPDELPF